MIEVSLRYLIPHDNKNAEAWRQAMTATCKSFASSGLCDPKFSTEMECMDKGKTWSCISEALVYTLLKEKKFLSRQNLGSGPDFLVTDGERRVWIEVVCPEPSGLSEDWLNCVPDKVWSFPHQEILLRWTSAIKAKADKFESYLSNKVVSSEDIFVIAVNGCRLRNGPFSSIMGISQHPVAAEVVFGFGPYQIHIDRKTLEATSADHSYRPSVRNQNDAVISTNTFMDDRFNQISAIWALDINGHSVIGGSEPKYVVHNPKATNPLSQRYLKSDGEYIATESAGQYTIQKIQGLQE
jgi:hypothetical protein